MTTTADTILAIDLGRFKSVAGVYSRSRLTCACEGDASEKQHRRS